MMEDISHLQTFLKNKDLDEETLKKYIKKYQETNCPKIYELIINGNMNYMIKMTRTFKQQYSYISPQELFSCINMGMEKAIDKYDETKGACFSTYALYWFKYFVNEYNLKNNSKVKISQSTYSKVRKLSGYIDEDTNVSNEELSLRMNNMSLKKIVQLKNIKECMSTYSISEDDFISNQMEVTLFEQTKIDYDPEMILECVKELGERDSFIIIERYGLLDGHPKTLGEIGSKVDLTAERVRQIITNRILPRLREIYKAKLKM